MRNGKKKRMTHLMITIMSNKFDCPVSHDKNNYVEKQTSKISKLKRG